MNALVTCHLALDIQQNAPAQHPNQLLALLDSRHKLLQQLEQLLLVQVVGLYQPQRVHTDQRVSPSSPFGLAAMTLPGQFRRNQQNQVLRLPFLQVIEFGLA